VPVQDGSGIKVARMSFQSFMGTSSRFAQTMPQTLDHSKALSAGKKDGWVIKKVFISIV
jgi:hypothetical protein